MKLQNSYRKPEIISHRGNLDGPNKERENHPDYLEAAFNKGYGIEFDVWYVNGEWALGHDEAQYSVPFDYLLKLGQPVDSYDYVSFPKSWMHLKNLEAVQEMLLMNDYGRLRKSKDDYDPFRGYQIAKRLNYFWHQDDDVTITNHGHIWAHPKVKTIPVGSGWVVPEAGDKKTRIQQYDYANPNWTRAAWVCVDYPIAVREMFNNLQKSQRYFDR